ncbi:MAG: hypothetical protein PHO69_12640 [Petrimonas sp.]|jgi:hypothetical protein|nr:hypothetical protein [Petrimonas sp.]
MSRLLVVKVSGTLRYTSVATVESVDIFVRRNPGVEHPKLTGFGNERFFKCESDRIL